MATYATAQAIVNSTLQELGLGTVNLDAAAADQTGYQLMGLLNALGQELLRVCDWQQYMLEHTITGDGAGNPWPLPDDWGRQVNQTQWAASDQRPMIGPSSPQQWAWNKFGLVSAGMLYQYRIVNDGFETFPVLAAGEVVKMYYISKFWVLSDTIGLTDRITAPSDICGFNERLLITGLKVKLWAAKGFDTTVLQKEFDFMLANEKATTGGAAVISLTGPSSGFLLGWGNIPDGSWNQ
jgi:hypothetical protein